MLTSEKKNQLIADYKQSANDTGSAEVQVALLTTRINDLQNHFAKHSKDHSSRRGLIKMVNQRRRLLDFLKKTSVDRYNKLIVSLGIRK